MQSLTVRSSIRRKSTALQLAVLYALFACAGQGLHAVAHLGETCCGDSSEPVACACGDGGCIFEKRAAGQAEPSEGPSLSGESPSEHDPHSCGVCQLLAQLKTAHGGEAQEAVISWTAPLEAAESHSLTSVVRQSYNARGPPKFS